MPEANGNNQPATRADVRALEAKMEGRLQRVEEKMDQRFAESKQEMDRRFTESKQEIDRRFAESNQEMDRRFTELTERLQEFVRDAQTELLRGFEAFAGGFDTRMRKVQADLSNVDASTDRRIVLLERRMIEIEKRLEIPFPPPPPAS